MNERNLRVLEFGKIRERKPSPKKNGKKKKR